jgi:hypothetical protein
MNPLKSTLFFNNFLNFSMKNITLNKNMNTQFRKYTKLEVNKEFQDISI